MHGAPGGGRGNDVLFAVERRVSSTPLHRNRVRDYRRRSVLWRDTNTGLLYWAAQLLRVAG